MITNKGYQSLIAWTCFNPPGNVHCSSHKVRPQMLQSVFMILQRPIQQGCPEFLTCHLSREVFGYHKRILPFRSGIMKDPLGPICMYKDPPTATNIEIFWILQPCLKVVISSFSQLCHFYRDRDAFDRFLGNFSAGSSLWNRLTGLDRVPFAPFSH